MKVAVPGVAAAIAAAFLIFAPVVSLTTDAPYPGGYSTITVTQGNTTRTVVAVSTPYFRHALGSVTFCYFGQGAVFVDGAYFPMTKVGVYIVGESCPAIRAS
jgi:hypothetical protein